MKYLPFIVQTKLVIIRHFDSTYSMEPSLAQYWTNIFSISPMEKMGHIRIALFGHNNITIMEWICSKKEWIAEYQTKPGIVWYSAEYQNPNVKVGLLFDFNWTKGDKRLVFWIWEWLKADTEKMPDTDWFLGASL